MNTKRFFIVPFFVLFFLHSSFTPKTAEENKGGKFVVVLDAGHGGHDPGNLGNGYLEKDIALNIVLKVGAILKKNKNIKVIYTRDDDTFVDLYVRGEIANKANADLFVSVHCDSHSSNAHGAGTFVLGLHANKQNFEIAKKENSVIYLENNYESRYANYDINSPESIIGLTIMQEEFLDQSIALAKGIQENFSKKLKRKDRQVKQAGFIVLHQTFMPSVLVETGFLTNKEEGAYLNSKKGQSEMSKAIADAIIDYKNGVSPANRNMDAAVVASKEEMKEVHAVVVKKKPETTLAKETVKRAVTEKPVEDAKKMADKAKAEMNKASETAKIAKAKEVVSKPAETKTPPKKEVVAAKVKDNKPSTDVVFKVQLMATVKKIPLEPSKFNGLDVLSKEPIRNLFRYMYGNVNTLKEAKLLKATADKKGYPSSYIVAYKNGVRIPISQAIKMVSE